LHSKSIHCQSDAAWDRYEPALHPAFFNRGAQIVYCIIQSAAIAVRIDYEMRILPEPITYTIPIVACIDCPGRGLEKR
jgi:hypothetical protein